MAEVKIVAGLQDYAEMLHERVFQTERKWPHFRLLLSDIEELSEQTPAGSAVVTLERGLLYGGFSLLGPYFRNTDLVAIDCSPKSAEDRGAYNEHMVKDDRFIPVPIERRAPIEATGLADACADLLIVPNLVHHVADQEALFREIGRLVKPGGRVYIFEPLVRELHQAPDDYLRYTPYGMERMLTLNGLKVKRHRQEGGPFSAVAYCWTQALEYLPEDKREEMSSWFYGKHFGELMAWDEQYIENKVRVHTSFPMAFSILASK